MEEKDQLELIKQIGQASALQPEPFDVDNLLQNLSHQSLGQIEQRQQKAAEIQGQLDTLRAQSTKPKGRRDLSGLAAVADLFSNTGGFSDLNAKLSARPNNQGQIYNLENQLTGQRNAIDKANDTLFDNILKLQESRNKGLGKDGGLSRKDQFKHEKDLRNEWRSNGITKDSESISAAFAKVETAARKSTPASNLALVFNFMKILDPGSTVREGEFKTAAQAKAALSQGKGGKALSKAPAFIRTHINRVLDGTILLPEQIEDFKNTAGEFMNAQLDVQDRHDSEYEFLAAEYGLEKKRIVGKNKFVRYKSSGGKAKTRTVAPGSRASKIDALRSTAPSTPTVNTDLDELSKLGY